MTSPETDAAAVPQRQAGESLEDFRERLERIREDFEERAAIMEYDGGLTREEAESEARRITKYSGW